MLCLGLLVHRYLVNDKRDGSDLHLNESVAPLGEYFHELLEPLDVRLLTRSDCAIIFQKINEQSCKPCRVRLLDVVMVEPEQFLCIEHGCGLSNALERKFFNEFLARKDLLVPGRPAETG